MAQHFDICIIGSGSGNTILDERYDSLRVAIVERGVFGGTCLNVGCIPTKMLVHPANLVCDARGAGRLGVDVTVEGVRWPEVRDRVFGRIDPISAGGLEYRKGLPNVEVFEGNGRFVGHKTLQVAGETIAAEQFVIAAGSRADLPGIPGLAETPFDTSDTIMRIERIPRRLAILGSGFIALEMAHVFDAYGAEVTIIARGDRLARREDEEISRRLTDAFVERLDVRLNAAPRSVSWRDTPDGGVFAIEYAGPDGVETVEADRLLVAAGRIPNGDQLEVHNTGVRLDDEGYVVTDDTLSTGVDGIWALGDVRNPMQLKHVANHEARVIQHNLLHPDDPRRISEQVVPYGIFTHPQVGSVGLKEHEAVAVGIPHVTYVQEYAWTAYGWAMEDTTSCMKVIGDPATRRLLGAHVVGPDAAVLVQVAVAGMAFGRTVDELARGMMWPHPALSEVVENALLGLANRMDEVT